MHVVSPAERVPHAVLPRGRRHELQQADGTRPGVRVRLEARLLKRLGRQEPPVPVDLGGVPLQQLVVLAELARGRGQVLALHALEVAAAVYEILLVEAVEQRAVLLLLDPVVQLVQ